MASTVVVVAVVTTPVLVVEKNRPLEFMISKIWYDLVRIRTGKTILLYTAMGQTENSALRSVIKIRGKNHPAVVIFYR